jgi:hypothetical protein
MNNLFRFTLVATALVAGSSTVMAQSRAERAANEAFAQSWNEGGPTRARTGIIVRNPARNSMNDVYDGSQYVGSDPSLQIRMELLRDSELHPSN